MPTAGERRLLSAGQTLMLNYGYDPQLSEGAVKPPVFLTPTFVFRTAEDGQDFFDFVSSRREPPEGMGAGLVYSPMLHGSWFMFRGSWPPRLHGPWFIRDAERLARFGKRFDPMTRSWPLLTRRLTRLTRNRRYPIDIAWAG
jgi:hypothetical protein